MRRTKLAGIAAAAVAMIGGPLGAAPAQAGCVHYACDTVFDTIDFVEGEIVDAQVYVRHEVYVVGGIVIDTVCTIFPTQPECM